ncbi:MAG: tail fiber protein [Flavipsychrobacter sp.]|nr:tail fiber protein [Flavipsychrobacter sp.]
MEAYVGAVCAFGFNFTPYGWLACNGQTVAISDYEVLYTLLGTTYGGNGTTNFAVPNLLSKVPIGAGQGPGLPNYLLGQAAGVEGVSLTPLNMPAHTHPATATLAANSGAATQSSPAGGYFANGNGDLLNGFYAAAGGSNMLGNTAASSVTGGANPPIEVMNPYQTVNYCICYAGVYPQQP